MTYVNITALTYPEGAEAEIEQRFAARKRAVDASKGFQGFELMRPVVGESRYYVVTRWDSREDYQACLRRCAARSRRLAEANIRGNPTAPVRRCDKPQPSRPPVPRSSSTARCYTPGTPRKAATRRTGNG